MLGGVGPLVKHLAGSTAGRLQCSALVDAAVSVVGETAGCRPCRGRCPEAELDIMHIHLLGAGRSPQAVGSGSGG